ncbi:hypothetical protein [Sandaracinus amylolyticus]|uniref:Uncharacterized protein n=1 Tax=Sandaracinus amylolyticus TaxID=927083 RepID=A0A0F6SER8_9BACT|nr:hypothetical protein [Sandaracinus amylolyticus]AKF05669.1 hypothetical protein DB32_002818 [Sandaracinus amylolyticus]
MHRTALVLASALAACAPDQPATGLALHLTATDAEGATYRLRDATFAIAGPETTSASTETDPDAATISLELAAGTYAVTLADGWRLERVVAGEATDVTATLVSPNPVSATVVAAASTQVRFRFAVRGDVVETGPGQLDIGIEVERETAGDEIVLGPWNTGAGTEETLCLVVDAGGITGKRVRAIHVTPSPGTYEVEIARTTAPLTEGATTCPGDIGSAPLFVATAAPASLVLPDDTELVLAPHEHVRILQRVANTSDADVESSVHVELDVLDPGAPARDALSVSLLFDWMFACPPHTTCATSSFHAMPASAELVALTTLTRSRADATVRHAASAADTTGALIHDAVDWSAPGTTIAAPRRTFGGEDGLRLTCTITADDSTLTAGLSSRDEICAALAYHR